MSTPHYSAFDRGFDLGHVDVPPTRSPVLSRGMIGRPPRKSPLKAIVAVAAVVIMISTGFAVLLPALKPQLPTTDQPVRAMAGQREVSYEISHFFESYIKNPNQANQGNRTLTEGLNTWWTVRNTKYGEYIIRSAFPYVTSYGVYSAATRPNIDAGFAMQTLARVQIVAKNLTTIGTNAGKDPLFVPILSPGAPGGGTVTLQWRDDVMTGPANVANTETYRIKFGTHFGNTYYGCPRVTVTDDGYWNELYGHMTFDRPAAQRYLGLPGVGDLTAEFTANNAGNAIGILWLNDWLNETGGAGIYDIAPAYDFSNDIRALVLTMDPVSTPNLLTIRIFSMSWGNDMALVRWMDAAGMNVNLQSYYEDMYFNATIGPTQGNITTSYYSEFAVLSWMDSATNKASWMIEATHIDYAGTFNPPPAWQSRFDPYDPDVTTWTRLSRLPGTTMYGQQVSYYSTPQHWNLSAGEKLKITLPTRSVVGYWGYVGASNTLNAAKVTELNAHSYWGEMVLGASTPDMSTHYNAATKVLSLTGPMNFPIQRNPSNPAINSMGVPQFLFDVTNVSSYEVRVLPVGGPYFAGTAYTVNVTARNITGVVQPWDGTVTLASNRADAVFGTTTHTFTKTSYWQTTVTFGVPSTNAYVNATDTFYLEIDGTVGPLTIQAIPEFGLLIIPVLGVAVMFAVLRRRKGK